MLKKSLVFILLAIVFNFAQGTPDSNKTDSLFYTDSLIAEQLALDTKHSYDIYYQNQIENERNQEGIGLNVLGSISGALLTGLGLTVMTGLSNEGATGAILAMPLLVSGVTILTANISGINESKAHAKRRMTYERAHQLYQSRKTGATEPAETASDSVAYNTLVAELLLYRRNRKRALSGKHCRKCHRHNCRRWRHHIRRNRLGIDGRRFRRS